MLRVQPHDALEDFRASCAHEPVNAENLAFLEVEAQAIKKPAATLLWQREILDFKHDLALLPVNPFLALRIRLLCADHLLDDPWHIDVSDGGARNELAVSKDRHEVADLHDLFETVRDVDDGDAFRRQLAHDLEKNLHFLRRKRGSRLVHDEDLEVVLYEVACDLDHLLLSHAKVADNHMRVDGMLKSCKDFLRASHVRGVVEPDLVFRVLACHEDVLVDAEVREEGKLLVNDADAVRTRCGHIREVDAFAAHLHFTRGWLLDAGDDLHQRRFASPVLADEHVNLALVDVEGNIVKRLCAWIDFVDLLCMKYDGNIRMDAFRRFFF